LAQTSRVGRAESTVVERAPNRPVAARPTAALVFAAVVAAHVAVGVLLSSHLDSDRVSAVGAATDWAVAGAIVGVLWLRTSSNVGSPLLAIACDSLPLFGVAAVIVAAAAALEAQWVLLAESALLVVAVGAILVPRARLDRAPDWTASAPELTIAVANVFVDNRVPRLAGERLAAEDADVVVLNEAGDRVLDAIDGTGAAAAYPFRIVDHATTDDYRVAVLSRHAFVGASGRVDRGPLRVVRADVAVGDELLTIVAVHLRAAIERGGHARWRAEIRALHDLAVALPHHSVIVGDFNASLDRAEMAALARLGFRDAHSVLGRALRPSLYSAASGPLRRVPTVIRVDHLLAAPAVHPLALRGFVVPGSDHAGFSVRLAVRSLE
jgi:endonuclease/exonuclease/phosphatase (EEP) superfamily protein YafD